MDLKAGDKVLISARYSKSIGVVKKVTPAGNIRLKNGELYTPGGSLKTRDAWNISHIQPLTPELEESLRQDSVIASVLNAMHNAKSITYEQALEIRQILGRGKDGQNL